MNPILIKLCTEIYSPLSYNCNRICTTLQTQPCKPFQIGNVTVWAPLKNCGKCAS